MPLFLYSSFLLMVIWRLQKVRDVWFASQYYANTSGRHTIKIFYKKLASLKMRCIPSIHPTSTNLEKLVPVWLGVVRWRQNWRCVGYWRCLRSNNWLQISSGDWDQLNIIRIFYIRALSGEWQNWPKTTPFCSSASCISPTLRYIILISKLHHLVRQTFLHL